MSKLIDRTLINNIISTMKLDITRILKRWYIRIDQKIILIICGLVGFNLVLVASTGSVIANKIGLSSGYFLYRQISYVILSIFIIICLSSIDQKWIKLSSILGVIACIMALILVKFLGYSIKGSTRWIRFFDFSFQPSEFIKPFLWVVIGFVLSLPGNLPRIRISIILYLIIAFLVIIQPDFGMLMLISAVFFTQLFVSGISLIWVILASLAGLTSMITAYFSLSHVYTRINSFLFSMNYQTSKSISAFRNGGLWGVGPGEGTIKYYLPDSHTDFIFAVAGEEFGIISCIILISLFAFIVIYSLHLISKKSEIFIKITSVGLITQLGLQAFINMAVTLNLVPTKGMTLPFVSYGGSSTISTAITIGILLNLTKNRYVLDRYKIPRL